MIKMPYIIPGFDYVKQPYAELVSEFTIPGTVLEDLGVCSDGVNHIYGIAIGDLSKPVVYIEGTIHGAHEWRCAYWVRKFAEILVDRTTPYWPLISRLRAKMSFYLIPCLNPYGYENNVYENANAVNLNRNFDVNWSAQPGWGTSAFSEPETQIVREKILALKPIMGIDCHTEGSSKGAVITIPRHSSLPNGVYTSLLTDAILSCSTNLKEESSIQIGVSSKADCWFTKQTSRLGRPTIGVTMEAGGGEPENTQAMIGLNMLLTLSVYAYRWMTERKMQLN